MVKIKNETAHHFNLEQARIVQEYLKKEGVEFEIKILSNPTKLENPISIRCNCQDWNKYRKGMYALLHI